jgi:hypothetical protein
LDDSLQRWRISDHGLHRDLVARLEDLHDYDDELHGDWSDQWHELHVHGDGDELEGYECCFVCVGCRGSVDGSWCSYVGVRYE